MNEIPWDVVDDLADDVGDAEVARTNKNHPEVRRIFQKWIDTEKNALRIDITKSDTNSYVGLLLYKLIAANIQKEIRTNVDNNMRLYSTLGVGMLGLGRVLHVDVNAQINEPKNRTKRIELRAQISSLNILYQELAIAKNIPHTIHGHPIFWEGEILQDGARTYALLGNTNAAIKNYYSAALAAQTEIEELDDEKMIAALLSSKAVSLLGIGLLTGDQSKVTEGLLSQLSANKTALNKQRTKDLGKKGLKSVLLNWTGFPDLQLRQRLTNFQLSRAMLYGKNN